MRTESLPNGPASAEPLERFGLLASAMSARVMQVAPARPGEPPWTDGSTVFIDAHTTAVRQLESIAVQASLLAAGSLDPGILRDLKRHPVVARRYLAVEGHRAL